MASVNEKLSYFGTSFIPLEAFEVSYHEVIHALNGFDLLGDATEVFRFDLSNIGKTQFPFQMSSKIIQFHIYQW